LITLLKRLWVDKRGGEQGKILKNWWFTAFPDSDAARSKKGKRGAPSPT